MFGSTGRAFGEPDVNVLPLEHVVGWLGAVAGRLEQREAALTRTVPHER